MLLSIFASPGSIFFFYAEPFQNGLSVKESKQEVTKVTSLVKHGRKYTKCIKLPQSQVLTFSMATISSVYNTPVSISGPQFYLSLELGCTWVC